MILGHPHHGHCFEEIDAAVSALRGSSSAESGVVFNAHNFPPPAGSIIYNLENFDQLPHPSAWAGHEVWDFSARNMVRWPGAMSVTHVPLGYHPTMKRFEMRPFKERDIDVIFFGASNPRRKRLFDVLRAYKLNVVSNGDARGAERNALLARSKLGLNLQYYENGVYPTPRAMHLLANGVPFLSEIAPEMPTWAKRLPHTHYNRLAEFAIQIVKLKTPLDIRQALEDFKRTPLLLPSASTGKAFSFASPVVTPVKLAPKPDLVRVLVVVVVNTRLFNVKEWIRCWEQREIPKEIEARLVVVHNDAAADVACTFQACCDFAGVVYVPRKSQGYDIGAFQDVCRERLEGFPTDYDALLWCTDDCLPMRKNFLTPFVEKLYATGVGIACMTLSQEWAEHVRTTGFCLRKETATALTFPVDPIRTKLDCYHFEHRGGRGTLLEQIRAMGLRPAMVAPATTSPLWDSDYSRRLPRQAEHSKAFPSTIQTDRTPPPLAKEKASVPSMLFVATHFDGHPEVVSSLLAQSSPAWELLLIDDNPEETRARDITKAAGDDRITYLKRPRLGQWGHPHRRWALEEIDAGRLGASADYVVITNSDNYYLPSFVERIAASFAKNPDAVAAYSGEMLHKGGDQPKHLHIACRLELGFIDCGGVVVRKAVASAVGWRSFEHSSDWTYFSDIVKKYGADRWVKADGLLYVHN